MGPFSDPIFGAENVPEPRREENNGIDRFLVFKSCTCMAPLSDQIFASEKAPEPKWEEHRGIGHNPMMVANFKDERARR